MMELLRCGEGRRRRMEGMDIFFYRKGKREESDQVWVSRREPLVVFP